jgi:D-glycero-alpha-D-manno-heptose-7-phosphate kinase
MTSLAYQLKEELNRGTLDAFGHILDENWRLKKGLTDGVSSEDIDSWYDAAMKEGALGGKILGAGTGGFLIFYAPEARHAAITRALGHLKLVKFGFAPLGSRIIFYNP